MWQVIDRRDGSVVFESERYGDCEAVVLMSASSRFTIRKHMEVK